MVIDDCKTVLASVRLTLERAGYEVLTRDVAVGATGFIMREKPDLLLLDVYMPAMDGPSLVEKMRNNDRLKGTPVILYSSESEAVLARRVRECGANGHLRKSSDLTTVKRLVDKLLGEGYGTSNEPYVLFVDDDLGMLRAFRRIVDQQFRGEFVPTPNTALDHILSETPPWMVVTDLVMPGLSGIELFQRAVQADENWRNRFVFVTGLAANDSFEKELEASGRPVLRKPLLAEQVARLLRCFDDLESAA